jgi:hypothetical protein
MALHCTTRRDGNALVVALSGVLGPREAPALRGRLLRCLAEQPAALFADVSRLTVVRPAALAAFRAVARQAARWPGAPVAVCGADRRALVRKALRRIPLFSDVDAATEHFAGRLAGVDELSDDLLPVAGAARHARGVATDACLRWDLPRLIGPASLIADELAGNVVDHAGTMAGLRFTRQERFLTIAVRDGSRAAPRRGGRGLRLVEACARYWGYLPAEGGKVVWATLNVR